MLTDEERELQEVIRQLQDIDLRCTRRESSTDHIAAFVPRPCDPLPYHPLPRWVNLPLDQKLPIVPCPPGMFHLSLNSIGDSIFENISGCNFDNEDPYIRRTPLGYDSLSDPNLRDFFVQRPNLLRRLERHGLINECGSVPCSVKEFNKYRDYLARLYSKDVQKEKDRWDQWSAENSRQEKKIRLAAIREAGADKEVRTKTRMEKHRAARERKQILMQLKDFFHPCSAKKTEMSDERKLLASQRDARKLQRDLRIAKIRKAEEERRRELVMQWYCRDLYLCKFRKCLKEWHRQRKICDLQSFIRYKREYQNQKLKYEKAINLRYKAEHQCAVKRRIKHFDYIERHRKELLKLKEVEREHRKARELYLMKKYGRRWLALRTEKEKNEATFHDSLWHIRYDLRHMVNLLREESGAVSFSNFIQDLVKLTKPHREEIKMTAETKTAVDYVLGVLLDNTFKEFVRKKASCAINFLSEKVRKKMSGGACGSSEVIPLDDFFPPKLRKRFKPQFPFERPPWPCAGPCAKFASKETKADKKWKKKCLEMAHAMNLVHDKISTYLTDRMFRAQQAKACADLYDPCGLPCLADVHKCEPPNQMRWIDELLNKQRKNLSFQQKLWPEEEEDFQQAAKWSDVPAGRKGRRRRKDMQLDCEDKLARRAERSSICEPKEETQTEGKVAAKEESKKKKTDRKIRAQQAKRQQPSQLEIRQKDDEDLIASQSDTQSVAPIIEPESKQLQDKSNAPKALKKDDNSRPERDDLPRVKEISERKPNQTPITPTAVKPEDKSTPSSVAESAPPKVQRGEEPQKQSDTLKVTPDNSVSDKKDEGETSGRVKAGDSPDAPLDATESMAAAAAETPSDTSSIRQNDEDLIASPPDAQLVDPTIEPESKQLQDESDALKALEVVDDTAPEEDDVPKQNLSQMSVKPEDTSTSSSVGGFVPPTVGREQEGLHDQSDALKVTPDDSVSDKKAEGETSGKVAARDSPDASLDATELMAAASKTQSDTSSNRESDKDLTTSPPDAQLIERPQDQSDALKAPTDKDDSRADGDDLPVDDNIEKEQKLSLMEVRPEDTSTSSSVAEFVPPTVDEGEGLQNQSDALKVIVDNSDSDMKDEGETSGRVTAGDSPDAPVDVSELTGAAGKKHSDSSSNSEDDDMRWVNEIVIEERRRLSDLQKWRDDEEDGIPTRGPEDTSGDQGPSPQGEEDDLRWVNEIIKEERRRLSDLQKWKDDEEDGIPTGDTTGDEEPPPEGEEDDLRWVNKIIKEERRKLSQLQIRPEDDEEDLLVSPTDAQFVDPIIERERKRLQDQSDALKALKDENDPGAEGDDLRWVNEIIERERHNLSLMAVRPENRSTSSSMADFVPPIVEREREGLQNQSDALQVILDNSDSDMEDEGETSGRVAAGDSPDAPLDVTELMAVTAAKTHSESSSNSEDDDMRWVTEIVREERRKLSMFRANMPQQQESDQVTTASSDAKFVSRIVEGQRKSLEEDRTRGQGSEHSGSQDHGDITQWDNLPMLNLTEPTPSTTSESDMSWVDEIVRDERRAMSEQLHLIRGDEIREESVATQDTRKDSGGDPAVVSSLLSPNSAFPSEDSVSLDPNEEGISVTRSEIRRQLNLMSEELEAIKAQLMQQGYLPPSSEDPPPGPNGS